MATLKKLLQYCKHALELETHMAAAQASAPDAIDAQLRATARVSFEAHETFTSFERELQVEAATRSATTRLIARKATTFHAPSPRAATATDFRTLPRAIDSAALKADAARTNDAVCVPYRAPSDHRFRVDSPSTSWLASDADFVAKFALPNNQDMRRRTARDQEGFHGAAKGEAMQPVSIRFQQAYDEQQRQQRCQPSPSRAKKPTATAATATRSQSTRPSPRPS